MAVDDPVSLDIRRRIHIVGIGGAGMSAIASVLAAMGHTVSGSDLRDSATLDRLRSTGIAVSVGHDGVNLPAELDEVAISTAIPSSNPEVIEAAERGVPVRRRAEVLAAICATRRTVAVAGTHGKTTTASMLALVLTEARLAPSFIIGGDVNEVGTGAVWSDAGDLFVVEADESDGTFLELSRHAAILTSAEPDHLEHYGGWGQLREAFGRFLAETPGPKVVCGDDDTALSLGQESAALSYGTRETCDYRIDPLDASRRGTRFSVAAHGSVLGEVHLPVAGLHNVLDAAASIAMGIELGASFESAATALGRFAGVARRFQHRGEVAGVTFIDDYAHLPAEVRAALQAARQGDWRKVVCVFQPHRYSRTEALWGDFATAFDGADMVVVTDIYPAGESPRPGVTAELIVDAVRDASPDLSVRLLAHRADLVSFLASSLEPGDLCLTLGAGDLTTLPDTVRDRLGAS